MRKSSLKQGKPDYVLLGTVALLVLLGILILASVSAAPSNFLLFRHILFGLLPGIALGYAAYKLPLAKIKRWAPGLLLVSLFTLLLVFIPKLGISAGGASRWINLGFTSFQPSEFLKITFILYLAAWLPSLSRKSGKFKPPGKITRVSANFKVFLAITGIIVILLALQPDVSTLGVIIVSAIVLYFLAGTPLKETAFMVAGGIALLSLLIKIAPYRFERFLVFIKPDIDPMGLSYQIKQALITVGSGGIFGKGLGMGLQRFGFIPQPMADSIFAIFSEETGFIGSSVMIALFLLFAWKGFSIAKKADSDFARLACLGLVSWITLQAFVNMGAMLRLVPLTGIPLPFISYGGSALVAELVAVGILLNVSRQKATV